MINAEEVEEPLAKVQRIETESETEQEKEANDTAAVLQDELIQAADRERQLQLQLDKMKDQLQKQLKQQSNVQKEFDHFKRLTAPLLEREMKQRYSKFNGLL